VTYEATFDVIALLLATPPVVSLLRNGLLFRPPLPRFDDTRPQVSILIPARNEEVGIRAAVESVLASEGVDLEVMVLDDHSTDRTAAIVRELVAHDSRVRLEPAPPLPAGWCGKQHACSTLAGLARFDVLTFLDADVRLAPDAVARLAAFQASTGAGLVSGFPRQETGTLVEKLVLPLINWLIVCYLPIRLMRASRRPGLGAGCGQWFLTTRAAYDAAGGHAAVKASLHDGVKLPRAYRRAGMTTDICDATDLATCRMYRGAGQVWFGLAKNAREGLGGPVGVWVWTVLLAGGHVLPFALFALHLWNALTWDLQQSLNSVEPRPAPGPLPLVLSGAACLASLLPRLWCAARFRQSWFGAVLHPVGVVILLAIQWYATVRAWAGRPVGWKGRPHPSREPDALASGFSDTQGVENPGR